PAFSSQATFEFKPGSADELISVSALSFSLPATNLKSGESGLDKNAYKALKTGQYKNITYTLTSATLLSAKGNKCLLKTLGNLTIAGVAKPVTMNVSCTVNKEGTITCTGSDQLKMSDYGV